MKVFILCIMAVALFTKNINGLSEAHKKIIRDDMMAIAGECSKTITLTEEEMSDLQAKKIPETENAKCFIACMMKKSGIMDDAGMISKSGVLAIGEKVFADAPEEIEIMKEFLETCKDVNTADVSDGDKGCDRAKVASECMKEHASKFSIDI